MIEDYTYNGLGLVSNITYTQDNTVKESYDYTYDNRGYITTESIINNYFSTAKNAAFSYTYDTIGRLTASAYTDNNTSTTSTTNYTYDAVGNRTSKTIGSATTTYTIGAYNQIASIGAAGETTSFTYDTHGNMTNETTVKTWTETQEGVNHSIETTTAKMYNYDSTNMMSSATVNINGISDEGQSNQNTWTDSAADTYIYNGDGQRVKKVADGITTKYYYSGSVVLYTADADNNKISGNIATPSGQIIATRDYANATNSDGSANTFANNYYFYHYDIRGSVTTLLKPDATIEQGYSYDEYGNATVENSASLFHNEMSYTGAISDSTTGLSYMNARYYNPATGTFTSQDTYYGSAYSPWTQHLYSYTGANPVNYVDPTGHTPTASIWQEISFAFKSLESTFASLTSLCAADGPYPICDTVAAVGFAGATLYAVASGIKSYTTNKYGEGVSIPVALSFELITYAVTQTEKNLKPTYVYTLMNPATEQIEYVGRTVDPAKRKMAHEASPTRGNLIMNKVIGPMPYYAARGLEQTLMLYYDVLKPGKATKQYNQINGISPSNPFKELYMKGGQKVFNYVENQLENEYLWKLEGGGM